MTQVRVQVLVSPHLADTTLTPCTSRGGEKEKRDLAEGFVYPEIADGEKELQKCLSVKTVTERDRSGMVKKRT